MQSQRTRSRSDYDIVAISSKKNKIRQRHYSDHESRRSRLPSYETTSGYETMTTENGSSTRSSKLKIAKELEYQQSQHKSPPPKYEEIYPTFVNLNISDDGNLNSSGSYDTSDITRRSDTSRQRSRGHSRRRTPYVSSEIGSDFTLTYSGRGGGINAPEIEYISSCRVNDSNSAMRLNVEGHDVDYQTVQPPTSDEAQYALRQWAKKKTLCSHKQASRCKIVGTHTWCAFRYTLWTHMEERRCFKKTKPYKKGQKIDKRNGHEVDIYDIEVSPPSDFTETIRNIKIPHSEQLRKCEKCSGNGTVSCSECGGCGTVPCMRCHGSPGGRNYGCHCHGEGVRCGSCGGHRSELCKFCQGSGQVISYKELEVRWTNAISDYIDEHPEVPSRHLLNEKGIRVHRRKARELKPLQETDILHKKIRHVSKTELAKHNLSDSVNLEQRDVVELVPVHRMDCVYKQKQFWFYMIGENNKIYAPGYPGNIIGGLNCFR
ncbi:protein SSUH2 homolog [Styela clava]